MTLFLRSVLAKCRIKHTRSDSMSELDMNLVSGISAFEAKEFSKAFKFLSPLAETGNAQAQYRRAAEQGLAGSQMTLGMLYEQGIGVEKNEAEARKWYEKAQQNS